MLLLAVDRMYSLSTGLGEYSETPEEQCRHLYAPRHMPCWPETGRAGMRSGWPAMGGDGRDCPVAHDSLQIWSWGVGWGGEWREGIERGDLSRVCSGLDLRPRASGTPLSSALLRYEALNALSVTAVPAASDAQCQAHRLLLAQGTAQRELAHVGHVHWPPGTNSHIPLRVPLMLQPQVCLRGTARSREHARSWAL